MENKIKELKNLVDQPDKLQKSVRGISLPSSNNFISSTHKISYEKGCSRYAFSPLLVLESGSKYAFGPTSVFHDPQIINRELIEIVPTPKLSNACEKLKLSETIFDSIYYMKDLPVPLYVFEPSRLPESLIKDSLSCFFKYSYTMAFYFIHRESFLYYFMNNDFENNFVSEELIYSMSALGARMSQNPELRAKADHYYETAIGIVFQSNADPNLNTVNLNSASVTRMQALLCLAIYDIGKGRLTSGWLLSGLAFRMGHDFGFELDPKDWDEDMNKCNNKELARKYPYLLRSVKSRIYWGCYVADHFISLALGRTTSLKLSDTNMPCVSPLADFTNVEEFVYVDPVSNISYSAYPSLIAILKLANLTESMLTSVFTQRSDDDAKLRSERLERLSHYNHQLYNWRTRLPKELSWNKSDLKNMGHNIVILTPRLYFYIISMCLNRPFLTSSSDNQGGMSPFSICHDVVEEVQITIKALQEAYGRNFTFISIFLLYCTLLSISILLYELSSSKFDYEKKRCMNKITFFQDFLRHCATIWDLGKKPSSIIDKKLEKFQLDLEALRTSDNSIEEVLNSEVNLFNFPTFSQDQTINYLRLDLANLDWENEFNFL